MAALDERTETQGQDEERWDFVHTGPGTLAGRYLRMFWQPICRSEELAAGRTKPVRIMGEDFTVYRGENLSPNPSPTRGGEPTAPSLAGKGAGGLGQPHVMAFRCAHRGTQLSTGWVEGDNLRCFYHGWTYDPSGQCVEQPAEPEPFCERIKIRSYPVEEYLGLIFAFLGEGEPPEFRRYPDFEREAGRETRIYLRRSNFFNNLDNDALHTYFVHRRPDHDFAKVKGRFPLLEAEEDEFGSIHWTVRPDGRKSTPNHRGMPNIVVRKQAPTDTSPRAEDSLEWRVPVDDESHLMVHVEIAHHPEQAPSRATDAPNWWDPNDIADLILEGKLGREYVDMMRTDVFDLDDAIATYRDGRITDMVKTQDALSQGGQGRIADRDNEHLGRTDVSVILFRNLWRRELRALAEGTPLTRWYRPDRYVTGL